VLTTEPRDNNFDAIRLLAALAVIIGHAWPLTGTPYPPRIAGIAIYDLAVLVFFSVSGYLITLSWQRTPVVRRFLAARVLRIFPALIVLVVLTTLVVGPFVTTLSAGEYFSSPVTWGYLLNTTLVAVYDLPGVFTSNPLPPVNGALWSLGPEFLCYLGVLGIGLLALRARLAGFIVLTVALMATWFVVDEPLRTIVGAMAFFGVSAVIAVVARGRMLPLWPAAVGLGLWLVVGALVAEAGFPLAWLVVPYAVVAVGMRATPVIRSAGRYGDFSYGLYLWGFLVQQVTVSTLGVLPLALDLLVVVSVTGILAIASWHLVERRALALKPRFR
jgi:peptidoglycan/LPS O-acetylase OafA/YrhL